jgi:hypothetical protein
MLLQAVSHTVTHTKFTVEFWILTGTEQGEAFHFLPGAITAAAVSSDTEVPFPAGTHCMTPRVPTTTGSPTDLMPCPSQLSIYHTPCCNFRSVRYSSRTSKNFFSFFQIS